MTTIEQMSELSTPTSAHAITHNHWAAAGDDDAFVTLIDIAQLYTNATRHPADGLAGPGLFHQKLRLFREQVNRNQRQVRTSHWFRKDKSPKKSDIKDYFFCSSLPAGAVLMNEPENRLYLTFPPDAKAPPWIAEELVRSEKLYIEIREILHNRDRVICLEVIFAVIVQLLRLMGNEDWSHSAMAHKPTTTLESAAHPTSSCGWPADWVRAWSQFPWPQLQSIYRDQVSEGWDLVRRIAERQAQVDYFGGMLLGAGALLVFLAVSVLLPVGHNLGLKSELAPLLWLCPSVGAIGAIVSVMQRMSTGKCGLRYRAGRFELFSVGAFRPLIGAVLASVIVGMFVAGLMPIAMSAAAPPLVGYSVAAFLAGFSERWAQDMLGAGKSQLAGGSDSERRVAAT